LPNIAQLQILLFDLFGEDLKFLPEIVYVSNIIERRHLYASAPDGYICKSRARPALHLYSFFQTTILSRTGTRPYLPICCKRPQLLHCALSTPPRLPAVIIVLKTANETSAGILKRNVWQAA
jgi:hypothetical protein